MPKISTIPFIIRENLPTSNFRREPEPDLIMDEEDQVNAFRDAGRQAGALDAIYIYHMAHASKAIQNCKTVIDLGCGPGIPLVKLARLNPHIHFIGLDLSEPMLERARQSAQKRNLKNIEFRLSDITDLSSFSDHSVDGVISTQAFHHLPTIEHLENTFKEVQRILKPDGAIYFQDLIRLKSRYSTIHFAYYDQDAPYLTQLDSERSMRAAFLYQDYVHLSKKYLPSNTITHKTAFVGLYAVIKTPSKPLPNEIQTRISAMKKNMRSATRKVYGDLNLFHKWGGLK